MGQTKADLLKKTSPAAEITDWPAAFVELQTRFNALLAKLDLDAGVTDTNYTALHAVTNLLNTPAGS